MFPINSKGQFASSVWKARFLWTAENSQKLGWQLPKAAGMFLKYNATYQALFYIWRHWEQEMDALQHILAGRFHLAHLKKKKSNNDEPRFTGSHKRLHRLHGLSYMVLNSSCLKCRVELQPQFFHWNVMKARIWRRISKWPIRCKQPLATFLPRLHIGQNSNLITKKETSKNN